MTHRTMAGCSTTELHLAPASGTSNPLICISLGSMLISNNESNTMKYGKCGKGKHYNGFIKDNELRNISDDHSTIGLQCSPLLSKRDILS